MRRLFQRATLVCFAIAGIANVVSAAEIAWSSAFEIETDADIDISNEIVRAVNVVSVDVGEIEVVFPGEVSVEFEPEHTFEFNAELDELFFSGGNVTGTSNYYTGQDEALTTENPDLDSILDSHGWAGAAPGAGVAVLELADLTVGQSYQLQLIGAADDRGCCEYRQMEIWVAEDEPATDVDGNELWFGRSNDFDQDGERGPGSVFGTFTADADTQQVWLVGTAEFDDGDGQFGNGNDPGLSAYILSLAGDIGPPGDYNMNGELDAGDLDIQAQGFKDGDLAFDLNGDGLLNIDDRLVWLHDLKNTWVGDANLDGEFSSADLVAVFAAGKYESAEMAGWAEGDWDANMEFTSGDLVAAFTDGGYELGPRPPNGGPAAVPEPSSLLLVLVALIGFGLPLRNSKQR